MGFKVDTKTMFYGRARRVKFLKQLGVIAIVVILLLFGISYLFKETKYVDNNVNYALLKNYFKSKGYSCSQLERDGGRCVYDKDSYHYSFTRYADGFIFLQKTSTYTIQIKHIKSTEDNTIIISTNSTALVGTRDKTYYCITDSNITGNLKSCSTADGEELKTDSYLGAVENTISDLNVIINASGYKRDALIEDYVWERAK